MLSTRNLPSVMNTDEFNRLGISFEERAIDDNKIRFWDILERVSSGEYEITLTDSNILFETWPQYNFIIKHDDRYYVHSTVDMDTSAAISTFDRIVELLTSVRMASVVHEKLYHRDIQIDADKIHVRLVCVPSVDDNDTVDMLSDIIGGEYDVSGTVERTENSKLGYGKRENLYRHYTQYDIYLEKK